MAVSYTALLTAAQINTEAEQAFDFDITDSNTLATLEAISEEVTGMLEGLLSRQLIVREYTHYVQYEDWHWDEARDVFVWRPPVWPVVEIDTSGFSAATSTDSWGSEANLVTYTSRYSGAINYYGGYKRSDQDLTALQSAGLTNLGTAPGNLPHDIRGVAINLCLHALTVRRGGPGQRTRVLNPAVQTTTIQEPILEYATRLVRERIPHQRRLC